MSSDADRAAELTSRIAEIDASIADGAIGVSVYDYLSGFQFGYNGSRLFHAASTIKIAVLAAVFDAFAQGRFTGEHRVHVRNRFLSAADGQPYRVQAARDADGDVHAAIGRTMRIED